MQKCAFKIPRFSFTIIFTSCFNFYHTKNTFWSEKFGQKNEKVFTKQSGNERKATFKYFWITKSIHFSQKKTTKQFNLTSLFDKPPKISKIAAHFPLQRPLVLTGDWTTINLLTSSVGACGKMVACMRWGLNIKSDVNSSLFL